MAEKTDDKLDQGLTGENAEKGEKEKHVPRWKRHRRPRTIVSVMRRKFIVSAMLAVSLVLVGIVAAINIVYYMRITNRADAQLEVVADSGGSFDSLVNRFSGDKPAGDDGGPGASREDQTSDQQASSEDSSGESSSVGDVLANGLDFTAETPYEMRYFSVIFTSSGEVASCDVSRIATVDETSAVAIAQALLDSGAQSGDKGYEGDLRYMVAESSDGSTSVVFLDCSRDLSSMRSLLLASIVVLVVALILVLALVIVFSKRALAPVEESYARQRRFITDASHDLKTPLAVIGSSADVIEIVDGPSEWVDSIRHQVNRMTDLTNKLVMLARMDEGGDTLTLVDFNLSALVHKVVEDFEPVAVANGRTIECEAPEELPVNADQNMVEQALSLLVDNALKYSTEGSTVHVSCEPLRRGHVRIAVENPCEAVAQGDHPELFERFYRSDSARGSSGGHGIGLAVVRAVAEAHGGSVSATSPDGQSMRFTLDL
ncbi:MAG: sensor histidine kinase [Tractidigestivibacter sp.]|jgi:two-component system sensor histidine kinase CiaH|uniref:sensor histidine kinase n=1 Tax=Tractidigestivibacter sp. TaxID=2847320 RepID=UPI003D8BB859